MRKRMLFACELVGTAAVVAGVALLSVPAAFIIAGVALVAAGNLPERR